MSTGTSKCWSGRANGPCPAVVSGRETAKATAIWASDS